MILAVGFVDELDGTDIEACRECAYWSGRFVYVKFASTGSFISSSVLASLHHRRSDANGISSDGTRDTSIDTEDH